MKRKSAQADFSVVVEVISFNIYIKSQAKEEEEKFLYYIYKSKYCEYIYNLYV